MSSAGPASIPNPANSPVTRTLPPVLGRLLSGTFWLALRVPLQAVFTLWTVRLILEAVGSEKMGAYGFAWGFGFFQFLLEFGVSSALQRQVSDRWTRGDRAGVDRSIACGLNFYLVMALVQTAVLCTIAYGAIPHTDYSPEARDLIRKLIWLQALTAPCYGISVVVSSVLQAARRYDFVPRLELVVVVLRFLILLVGLRVLGGSYFFTLIAAQTLVQIALTLGPAIWVMVGELGHVPGLRGARFEDYKALGHISFYMALIQLSVVLGDKIDTTILGFMLSNPGDANAVYGVVSKPFLQLRQTGWMLAYMVMPAVASLSAARDWIGIERVKYDGTRLHFGILLPVGLLAWIHAGPFLSLWVGNRLGYDAQLEAPMMRLFLIAAIPLILSVPVQMAIGMNRIEVIALAALGGSLVNLPVSCYLTWQLKDVSGVIWGTVLTTLFSNLLVPGFYVFRVLEIRPRDFFERTLLAPLVGAACSIAATVALRSAYPLTTDGATLIERCTPLLVYLVVGTLGYLAGYAAIPVGRKDFAQLASKLRPR
ncbi:MAG: polysaccharide biosynthesis protein [Planctomycetes bacterium SCN 63-9]|nr:MAG: polysaccharide biosynthesis protein [Planctomycetes bacterium SCN 63-9]